MRGRAYIYGKSSNTLSLLNKGFGVGGFYKKKRASMESLHGGEEDGNLHFSFRNGLMRTWRWRSKEKGNKTLGLELSSLKWNVVRKRKKRRRPSLYRKWRWIPQLKSLLGLKTWISRLWMHSTKKEELFVEISSFQKNIFHGFWRHEK